MSKQTIRPFVKETAKREESLDQANFRKFGNSSFGTKNQIIFE